MQKIRIDFGAAGRGSPWLGRGLLAVAAAVWVDAGFAYLDFRDFLKDHESHLARRAPAARVSPQEVAAARETVQRLSLPWDGLFLALESAASDKVALTVIEPDAANGTVKISADGKDYLAVLSYVSNLSRTEGLGRVQLVSHEQKPNAVSFGVSAAWVAR
jgi:hypothetical protein